VVLPRQAQGEVPGRVALGPGGAQQGRVSTPMPDLDLLGAHVVVCAVARPRRRVAQVGGHGVRHEQALAAGPGQGVLVGALERGGVFLEHIQVGA